MEALKESINENGVLQPVTCFLNENGYLEIISGHRRKRACELLGFDTIPVLIKRMTRDEAIVAMGESNLKSREKILPSEKAFTYRAMYDAMKRQGKREDLTSFPVGTRLRSDKELAKKVGEGSTQIQRYIRLTYLYPLLLDLVDESRIGMRPAVEMSYFPMNLQECIWQIYDAREITPSHAQTLEMKKLLNERLLDENAIDEIMSREKPNQKKFLKLSETFTNKYLYNCRTQLEMENRIAKALELLDKQEKISGKKAEAEYER